MPDSHANQGIELGFVVKKALPVGEKVAQVLLPFGRGIDDFTGAVIRELSAWRAADIQFHAFQGAADFYGGVGGQRSLGQG
ncbi:hypothetical protein D3C86_1872130 [compost metagenome]